jgi:MFS family permease
MWRRAGAEYGQARSALYAVAFLSSLGFSIVVPFLVLLVLRYGGNAFVVGAVGAAFWAAQLVGATWLGTLSDRIGRKRVLFRSQLGAIAGWTIFLVALWLPAVELARVDRPVIGAFALTLPLVLITVARVVDGLFNGSVSVASAYVADIADETERKLAYGRLGAATNLGFVIGPTVAGLLARGSVRPVLVLALVLSALAALLIRHALPALPVRPAANIEVARRGGVRAHKPLGGGCVEAVRHPRMRVRELLVTRELRVLIALYFLVYLAFSIFVAALPVHAIVENGWSAGKLGLLYALLALSLTVTEALVLPRVTKKLSPPAIAAFGSALLIAAYILISMNASAALLAGGVLYGVGNGLMWPSYLMMLSEAGPHACQGAIQGLGSSVGSLASIVGTLAGGLLYVNIGVLAFYISAATVAVVTILFVTWGRYAAAP